MASTGNSLRFRPFPSRNCRKGRRGSVSQAGAELEDGLSGGKTHRRIRTTLRDEDFAAAQQPRVRQPRR